MNELRLRGLTQISAVSLVRQTQEEGQVFWLLIQHSFTAKLNGMTCKCITQWLSTPGWERRSGWDERPLQHHPQSFYPANYTHLPRTSEQCWKSRTRPDNLPCFQNWDSQVKKLWRSVQRWFDFFFLMTCIGAWGQSFSNLKVYVTPLGILWKQTLILWTCSGGWDTAFPRSSQRTLLVQGPEFEWQTLK